MLALGKDGADEVQVLVFFVGGVVRRGWRGSLRFLLWSNSHDVVFVSIYVM